MKKNNIWILLVIIVAAATSCQSAKNTSSANAKNLIHLNTALDSACYSIGVNFGAGLGESLNNFPGGTANVDALAAGFLSAIKNDTATLLIAPEAAQAYIQLYMTEIKTKEDAIEKEKGEAFLAENRTKEGVITTESGLQYKILKQGEGEIPTPDDQVKVHYTGRLRDGTVFDSSVQRGEPAVFGVTQVIKGWSEVLQLMPSGSKYQIWLPSELGYGAQGAGDRIKANSMLEFDVELLEVIKN